MSRSNVIQGHTRNLKLLTWNVRGLNDHSKLRNIIAFLKRRNIDLALLQETHLQPDSTLLKTNSLVGLSHTAGFSSHSRGVLTWVNPKSGLQLEHCVTDQAGRYIITRCHNRETNFLIVNSYGPNYDDPQFYLSIAALIKGFGTLPILWGGDLNCVLDPALDRSKGAPRAPSAAAKIILDVALQLHMVDVWRARSPQQGGYTHYTAFHDIHTRIDYWFISASLMAQVQSGTILARTFSDHSPILLELNVLSRSPPLSMAFSPLFSTRFRV